MVRSEEPTDHRGLRVFGLQECLERLRSASVGRLAFMDAGGPVILPLNHGVDGMGVVFRSTWGSKLQVAEHSAVVAFEVDGYDRGRGSGWSVLVKGTLSIVYEDSDIARFEELGVPLWADIGSETETFWVRLRPDEITGREIIPAS